MAHSLVPANAGTQLRLDSGVYLKVRSHLQELMETWCHGCAEGSSVLGHRAMTGKARMSPAGRNTSVAPDSVAALSCSVVTDRQCCSPE